MQFYELYFSADKQRSEIAQCTTKSNHLIRGFLKQINGCIKFHKEKTEERRELMWRIQDLEEAEVVEADHPGIWMELPEKISSKTNKVEFISNGFSRL